MTHEHAEHDYEVFGGKGHLIKAWTRGVAVDPKAKEQLVKTAQMPFIHKWVAAMPDVHVGIGATVGSVVASKKAIIPAAVGVDIGCGMMATRTTLTASQLPDNLAGVRSLIERLVPHGRTNDGRKGDRGAWGEPPEAVQAAWGELQPGYAAVVDKHPRVGRGVDVTQLGTLGTGNHFIEVCLDEEERVWVMLHSGSRGVGNRIGTYFIEKAKQEMRRYFINLPDEDLSYLAEGSVLFDDYWQAVSFAQRFALKNRELMMAATLRALSEAGLPPFVATDEAVNCHHNYVARENHFGEQVLVTRKGAVRARKDDLGIIPGSMGARSFIVRGLGNPDSFHSCSHGAGRLLSRTEAKRRFTVEDHVRMTAGIECRKDAEVVDETPAAYKPIDDVMAAQRTLVEIVHTLRQVVCVKG
ncbi:MAG: RtcB family protein [Deltaproteobacteria bacterium]|nr:RtcB family protein [Deltaproteobacteria bacterium]